MSKHSRRSEQVQSTRGRSETGLTQVLPDSEGSASSDAAVEARTLSPDQVGKYWVVVILWAFGFLALIGIELISALFKR